MDLSKIITGTVQNLNLK